MDVQMVQFDGINLICFAILITINIYLCMSKKLLWEKKIIITLAIITFFLGFIGMRLSYQTYLESEELLEIKEPLFDIVYFMILMFKGEWNWSYESNIWIEISRFMALLTSIGLIMLITLKQRYLLWKIKLYKNHTIIVSNKPSGYIMDFIEAVKKRQGESSKKEIVFAFIDEIDVNQIKKSVDIPLIFLNLESNTAFETGIKECNFSNAKSVYLLCEKTEDNIQIAKKCFQMQVEKDVEIKEKKELTIIGDEIKNGEGIESFDQLKSIENYVNSIYKNIKYQTENFSHESNENSEIKSMIRMYIQCLTDEERSFYSFDRAFHNMSDKLDTVFINPYDISIRQMLVESNFMRRIGKESQLEIGTFKKNIDKLKICVTGHGKLLERTIIEISRNIVFSKRLPLEMTYIDFEDYADNYDAENILSRNNLGQEYVKINKVCLDDLAEKFERVDMIFVSDVDEQRVKKIMQRIFQKGIQNFTHEFFIISKGNDSEYEVLNTYISALFRVSNYDDQSGINPICYVSRVTDLLLGYDDFYKKFSPSREEVYKQYREAIAESYANKYKVKGGVTEETFIDLLEDFRALPEIFKDSDTLCAIHNHFIMDYFKNVELAKEVYTQNFENILCELVYSEHFRWFNERVLQGYVYDENKNNLISTNNYLLKWDLCTNEQRINHTKFTLKTIDSMYNGKIRYNDNDSILGNGNDYINVYGR